MLSRSAQEFHALQWWGTWYQYQCERWVNDGQLCPSHLSSINNLVSKLIFKVSNSLPPMFPPLFPMLCQGEGRNVLPPLTPVLTSWLPKCPPHPTSQQTIGSPLLTRRHSHLWGLTPSKPFLIREISPQLHMHVTHLFTGLDVFDLPICFYLSCLSSKFPVCVRNGWNSSQFIGWLLKNLLNVHLSLPSGVDSCQATITYDDPDLRTNPSKALRIHVFFQRCVWDCNSECMMALCRVSDCNSVFTITTCLHKCSRLCFWLSKCLYNDNVYTYM